MAATPPPGRMLFFYALLITEAVSAIGSQISGYAVSIAVFRASGHATPLALVAFFSTAPAVLLGGYAGALADRFDRRTVMLSANAGFIVVSSLLLLSFGSGRFQLWHLYTLTVCSSAFATLQRPAFQASITMLVPDSHRDRANAVRQISGSAAGVVAPALAGMLYALAGVVGSISIDLVTFVLAVVVLSIVHIPKPPQTADGLAMRAAVWRQVFDGFRYLAARPVLLGFCGFISALNFMAAGASVLLTPYILTRTGSAQWLGVLLAMTSLGGIAGALLISTGRRIGSRMNTVMLAAIAFGVFVVCAGVSRAPLAIGASLFMMIFSSACCDAPFWSILQAKVAPDLQGRVFSAVIQIALLMAPLASLAAGPLADRVFEPAVHRPDWQNISGLVGAHAGSGMGLIFVIEGVLILTLGLIIYAKPRVRRLEDEFPSHVTEPEVQ